MAPLTVRIIAKSLVSDRIIIDTIVGKYADHNPLFRQSVILPHDAGICAPLGRDEPDLQ